MFFPLNDENPTRTRPVLTVALIVANSAVWLYEFFGRGVTLSVLGFGVIPRWIMHGISAGFLQLGGLNMTLYQAVPWPFTVLTSMFTHGGWLHIIGNMWFLWIFGDNLEDRMGRFNYLVFYLLCGIAAAVTQVLAMPNSTAPMVGASGAIAGVLGGYIFLYPMARVRCLVVLIIFITTVRVPAFLLLGFWFLYQFFTPNDAGVAWMAHVGGFLAGLALVKLFVNDRRSEPPRREDRGYVYN